MSGIRDWLQQSETLRRWIGEARTGLIALPRPWKRLILGANDFVLLTIAVWLAVSLRYNELFFPPDYQGLLLMLAAPAIGVVSFSWFGMYRLVTRYITIRGSSQLLKCIGLSTLIWATLAMVFGAHWIPRSAILVLYPLIGGALIFTSRQVFAATLRTVGVVLPAPGLEPRPVVVYGTGRTAVQLVDALHSTGEAKVVGLLDSTPSLWGQFASGVKIYRPDKLSRLIEREAVKEVILALPEAQRRERHQILKQLEQHPVRVKMLPAIEDFASGRAVVSELRPVDVEDLLGRNPVLADPELLPRSIVGRTVMVTGAGGSIGSELVRQILKQGPTRLVLFELSEVALYEIEMEALEIIGQLLPALRPTVVAVLGTVQDSEFVRHVISTYDVATIYHAAAYKHVPIVERNPIAGIANNTFGTEVVAAAARDLGVERFVLISTDKAVRPTNVMGCSKRLAEMILQSHASDPDSRTIFTMVRFGNVLDSSGSVVRLFRKQIQAGGPVTVTHPEIVRYFMSIPEAACLVLQAGAIATGGEVFVLDMGEPVKIDALARSMIRLMGLEVRDENNPDGDIQISYVGLRPGEKLYEELLIGENTTPTKHPLIRRSHEPHPETDHLERELDVLQSAMERSNLDAIQAVLMNVVEDYHPDGGGDAALGQLLPIAPASRTLH